MSKNKTKNPNAQLDSGTKLLNRYLIVKRVGGGGMGNVYLARDQRLADTLRAVKEMIELYSDDNQRQKAIEDFEREAQLLASLEHPSIPTVYDYFIENGRYYLVMKYIGGGDLAGHLRQSSTGRMEERTVAEWGMQICDVLSYIHSQRPPIIYRDLKPANLMIDDKANRVMLVDFGIARFVAPTSKGVTAIGTMGYAPPELFSGKVEPRSDLYSLGATMFHLLTGADPQDNPLLIFDFTKNPRPSQINPQISRRMEDIIIRSVEHKPEKRFRDAADMKGVLEEHLRFLDSQVVRVAATPGTSIATNTGQQVFCGNCGQRIAAEDLFCAHCGAKQLPAVNPNPLRATAKLIILGGSSPISFMLDKENHLIGRVDPHTGIFPEVDLSNYDPETKVSRRHARVYREGHQFLVEDLSSVNGTVVNGKFKLYPKQPHILQHGDELTLGETILKFVLS